jgi:hypothetical protein
MLLSLALAIVARGQAWTEYEVDLGNGYELVRFNDIDVGITGPSLLFGTNRSSNAGPIVEYAVTRDYIFTHHAGRRRRNLFAGDTLEEVDYTKDFYFTLEVSTGEVLGPFTLTQFNQGPAVAKHSPIQWTRAENPNFEWVCPVLGFGCLTVTIVGGVIGVVILRVLLAKPRRHPG